MIGWRTFVCGCNFANTQILIRIELIWPSLWLVPLDHPSDHLGHLSVPEHPKLWPVPAWSYAQDSLESQGVFSTLPAIPSVPGLWLCLSGRLCSALLPLQHPLNCCSSRVCWWLPGCGGFGLQTGSLWSTSAESHGCLCSDEADSTPSGLWFLYPQLLIMGSGLPYWEVSSGGEGR